MRSVDFKQILLSARNIAVVGLSNKPTRPSHGVSAFMQAQGYRIIPINPAYLEVLGERCYPSLLEVPKAVSIDTVNVFRRREAVPLIVQQAIQVGAQGIWMQEGVAHEGAAEEAARAGLWVVMDRCILKEYQRWIR
ncbi:MAG: CoA-binding protein [Acidobacteriota bacterium]